MDFWFSENNGHIKCASRWDDQGTTFNVFHRPTPLFPPYTRWIGPELSISRQKFRITGSRVRMEARFFSNLNGASLHSAFHFHLSIVLIWLKYCWKGSKTATNPWMTGNLLYSVSHVYPLQWMKACLCQTWEETDTRCTWLVHWQLISRCNWPDAKIDWQVWLPSQNDITVKETSTNEYTYFQSRTKWTENNLCFLYVVWILMRGER